MNAPSLREVLRSLPASARPVVDAVLAGAREGGFAVYLVGGPVRDLLLGRPVADVDLIVERRGQKGAEQLARAAAPPGARLVVHDRFGTVRLEFAEGAVDLATTRRESYAHPGALPRVEPGSLEEDLARRDFTINALAIPLTPVARRRRPAVIAPEGGLPDLEQRLLRVLHPKSFHDDPTRALRGARLAERLAFHLSRGSRSALRDALRDGAFGRVSGERLRREVEKLFADAAAGLDPARALRRLGEWHVLGALEPELHLPQPARAPLRRLGRALATPPWRFARLRPWVAGLSVWLAPLDAGLRRRALRRVAVRGEVASRIAGFPRERDTLLRALAKARGRGAVDRLLGEMDEDRLLALAVWASPTIRRRCVRYAAEDRGRKPPVGGNDLLGLGLKGPEVGRALVRIRAAWLDGAVRNRDEALALARELGSRRVPGRRAPARPRTP